MTHPERPDRSPAIAELLDDAYVAPVGVEAAARHLWAIHAEANRAAALQGVGDGPAAEPVSLATRRVPRAAVPVLALVMAMSSSGMALAASQTSLPGDVLYPVKRGTEQAQLIFARDAEARAQLQLSFARTRLEEIRQIAATRPQHVPALVAAINVTLSQVQLDAPEDSERVRREVDAEIAGLELPATATQAATADSRATASTSQQVATPTATATEAPSPGATTSTDSTTGPLAAGAASAEPTATASPSGSEVTASDGVTTGTTTDGPTATGGTADPADGEPTPSPTPSPTPTPTTSTSEGPIVTARPHPGEAPDGTSRTEDPTPAPTAEPTPSEPTEQPSGQHFSRPD